MTTSPSIVDDPQLGRLTRAESTLDDGSTVMHDWFAGCLRGGDAEIDLLLDGADADAVRALLPRARAIVSALDDVRVRAADAVVTRFSDGELSARHLDDARRDLQLDMIEVTDDATVLHFTDASGEHFPEGYWPAAHLDADGAVIDVTVES